ncbi:MAG: hypothetical protein Q9172_006566 [Xanthocarpia lactea]
MSRQAADIYYKDTSGPRKILNPGSKTEPLNRIYYRTHEKLLKGLLGQGLSPMTDRLEEEISASMSSLQISEEWMYFPDLMEFYQIAIGSIVIKTIFGGTLLSRNPDFVRMLWEFDGVIMRLAKRLPIICAPKTYWLRRKLLECIKRWHTYARTHSAGFESTGDQDSDPLWGCKMIRERYLMLRDTEDQDHESVASTDLAFIWSAVTNVTPSSMALLIHTISDASVLAEVRQEIARATESSSPPKFRLRQLEQQPLLLSLYAETLRHGVQIHIPRDIPHKPFNIGDRTIPSDQILFVNTWLAHTDQAVWNTKDGAYPLEEFWARRFLINPKDPSSGPCKNRRKTDVDRASEAVDTNEVRYSTEGLEGAWIPYGGKSCIRLSWSSSLIWPQAATMLVPAGCWQSV